jgi:hypothetical protein
MKEIEKNNGKIADNQRCCRKEGGGRKSIKENYPEIKSEIEKLLAPYTKGDPMNPLKNSSKGAGNIEKTLLEHGYKISDTTIMELLKECGCSLQANRKEQAMGKSHEDRDEQFEYIIKKAIQYSKEGFPVLSIDAKKKEIIGEYRNNGREYHKKSSAPLVYDHEFIDKLGKATHYGIYDIFKNVGFVNVGLSGDTSEFAVESIKKCPVIVAVPCPAKLHA